MKATIEKFLLAKSLSDCFRVDNGEILQDCGEGPDDDIFYACWDDGEGLSYSCHIPESSFLPENNPQVNADGDFVLKDHDGYETIIAFYTLNHIDCSN